MAQPTPLAGAVPGKTVWEASKPILLMAAVVLILVGPLYYREFVGRPSRSPSVARDMPAVTGRTVSVLEGRLLEVEENQRFQEKLVGALSEDCADRKQYVRAAVAVFGHRPDRSAGMPELLLRTPGERLEFNDAVLAFGGHILEQGRTGAPIVPINGHRASSPSSGDNGAGRTAYYLAQDAAVQLSEILHSPDAAIVDDGMRRAILDHLDNPSHPLPAGGLRYLASVFGKPPVFLVVNVDLNGWDFRQGQMRFVWLDAEGHAKAERKAVPFHASRVPLALLECFGQTSQQRDALVSPRGGEEVAVTFRGTTETARVSFSSSVGLPIAANCPDRLVELCFEAKAETASGAQPLKVQFGSGGDEMFVTTAPPSQLGPTWSRLSIPIELGNADRWTNGLFVEALFLSVGDKVTITIRNAYIRPVRIPFAGQQVL